MNSFVPNILLDGICKFLVILLVLYNYRTIMQGRKGTGYLCFTILIILYSLFYRPEGGDFWHYLETYEEGPDAPYRHMEDFYYWVMSVIPSNYLLWRTIIWSLAALAIVYSFRLLNVQDNFATTFFLLFGLSAYYYTRNSLALSVLYFGIALFCNIVSSSNKTVRAVLLFILFALASWYLHRSMPMYILFAILSIIIPLNKKFVLAALFLFPLLYYSLMNISYEFINYTHLWMTESGIGEYLESQNEFYTNWKGLIGIVLSYTPIVYFYAIAFTKPIPTDDASYLSFKVFLLFSFILFYVSFLFLGQGATSIQGRIYKSSFIPFSFVVAQYFQCFYGTKECRIFVYLLLVNYSYVSFAYLATM